MIENVTFVTAVITLAMPILHHVEWRWHDGGSEGVWPSRYGLEIASGSCWTHTKLLRHALWTQQVVHHAEASQHCEFHRDLHQPPLLCVGVGPSSEPGASENKAWGSRVCHVLLLHSKRIASGNANIYFRTRGTPICGVDFCSISLPSPSYLPPPISPPPPPIFPPSTSYLPPSLLSHSLLLWTGHRHSLLPPLLCWDCSSWSQIQQHPCFRFPTHWLAFLFPWGKGERLFRSSEDCGHGYLYKLTGKEGWLFWRSEVTCTGVHSKRGQQANGKGICLHLVLYNKMLTFPNCIYNTKILYK